MSSAPAEEAKPGGIRLGRVLGVPVFVAWSWFLFAGLIVAVYGPALSGAVGATRAYVAATSFAVLLLLSVLLHEVGHAAVARLFGLPVRSITVTFLAGLTEITRPPQTPGREYAVAVAGPMVSLLLAGLGVAAIPLFDEGTLSRLLVTGVAVTNGIVAAFNLLPGLPLDGGRVLRAGLWKLTGDPHRSTRMAAWAGRGVAVLVVPALLLLVLPAVGFGEPTITTAVITGLVAVFIYAGATASLSHARLVARLPMVKARELSRPALTVPADLPLAEAVRRAHEARAGGIVVVDAGGGLEAVVLEAAVTAVPEERRPWVQVSTAARRIEPGLVLDPGLTGEDLLEAMRAAPSSEYVLLDRATGEVRVLATSDVVKVVSG